MGCDIHLYAERREGWEGGTWTPADKWGPSKYEDEKGRLVVDYDDRLYTERNYDLFAILADVRNGYGFAGVPTGGGFVPIAPPKGLPRDVSAHIAREAEAWGVDGHSHSWHTVADLLAYDWTRKAQKVGVVSAAEFEYWDRMKQWVPGPESYAGDVCGREVRYLDEETLRARIAGILGGRHLPKHESERIITEALPGVYCRIRWEESYSSRCKDWWWEAMPKLLRLGKPEEVRIVFWFDN